MGKSCTVLLLAWASFAQSPADLFQKAPPDVDDALRARMTEFYQDHVDGKFRQAEQLVAEDSKDFFYQANKPKYLSFQITRIEYSDHFTKAKATVVCEMFVPVMGFMNKPMKVPTPSRWKLVDGKWYWYVDLDEVNQTPFGKMKAGGPASGGGANLPPMPDPAQISGMLNKVAVDRSAVRLTPGSRETQQVTITNHMPGAIQLEVQATPVAGLDASLNRTEVRAGEKAVLTLSAAHVKHAPAAAPVKVRVVQTNQLIPVNVAFARP